MSKSGYNTEFIGPKGPQGPKGSLSLLCFSLRALVEIAPVIARGDSRWDDEKKAGACFRFKFSLISVKITEKKLNKLIISLKKKS